MNAPTPLTPPRRSRQHGSALIVSLLILVVMTLIGVTALSTSGMEEKMAGNARDRQVAFQAAEAALRDAESFVSGIASTADFNGTNGQYGIGSTLDISPGSAIWTGTNSKVYAGTTLPQVRTAPRYVIQVLSAQGNHDVNIGGYGDSSGVGQFTGFRITARGTGISDQSAVILQSYYGMRL